MNTAHNTEALKNHAAELARLNDITAGLVMNALNNGASWTEIGAALGVSKQTAHARYGKIASKISIDDVAGKSVTPSIFSDAPAPATTKKPSKKSDRTAQPNFWVMKNGDRYTPARTPHTIPDPDETAQPGIGTGPHQCPGCGDTNHKTEHKDLAVFTASCIPTKYDPPKIAALMNQENRA